MVGDALVVATQQGDVDGLLDAVGPLVVGGVGSAIGLPFGFAAFAVVALVGTLVASRLPSKTDSAQDA